MNPKSHKKSKSRFHNLPHLKTFRTELRNNLTPAEAKLWTVISRKRLDGRKFRRQHSVANFILDFYCPAERLCIELDGQTHFRGLKRLRDLERGLFLDNFGIRVIRFENKIVFQDLPWVISVIKGNFGWWRGSR
ncbi:MAG: DUF559 domain-containing protein [Pyrinomonadaceae bacterium]|nr:DUF559 domain-containing protein [Pyrinomonadaceae bacterium]